MKSYSIKQVIIVKLMTLNCSNSWYLTPGKVSFTKNAIHFVSGYLRYAPLYVIGLRTSLKYRRQNYVKRDERFSTVMKVYIQSSCAFKKWVSTLTCALCESVRMLSEMPKVGISPNSCQSSRFPQQAGQMLTDCYLRGEF